MVGGQGAGDFRLQLAGRGREYIPLLLRVVIEGLPLFAELAQQGQQVAGVPGEQGVKLAAAKAGGSRLCQIEGQDLLRGALLQDLQSRQQLRLAPAMAGRMHVEDLAAPR